MQMKHGTYVTKQTHSEKKNSTIFNHNAQEKNQINDIQHNAYKITIANKPAEQTIEKPLTHLIQHSRNIDFHSKLQNQLKTIFTIYIDSTRNHFESTK